jgi:hypothetical protein
MGLSEEVGLHLPEKPLGERDPLWSRKAFDDFSERLASLGEEAIQTAMRILGDALGGTEPPWWACFAEEVQDRIDVGDAAGLCSALGLGHRWAGEWLAVWCYSVADAGQLYRPTVAEAHDSPFHYPSPPEYGLGITMPLDPTRSTCREVLHPPLRGRLAEANCTGKLLFLESFTPLEDNRLKELRRLHRARLRSEFDSGALAPWLDRHPEI